jgi:hypothetical protein
MTGDTTDDYALGNPHSSGFPHFINDFNKEKPGTIKMPCFGAQHPFSAVGNAPAPRGCPTVLSPL